MPPMVEAPMEKRHKKKWILSCPKINSDKNCETTENEIIKKPKNIICHLDHPVGRRVEADH